MLDFPGYKSLPACPALALQARVKPISSRALSAYYITALMIIAGLTISSHAILSFTTHHNQGSAAIINASGRQRMLSQRIASLAAQYRLGDASARGDLLATTAEFQAAEAKLSAAALPNSAIGAQLHSQYASLEAETKNYISDARLVAALPPGAPQAAAPLARIFAEARAPLIDRLNQVVALRQLQTERLLDQLEIVERVVLLTVLLTLMVEALTIFRPMIRRVQLYTREILSLATIDPLTGVANRGGYFEASAVELARSRRYQQPLALLMVDADHFKSVNDTYGHAAGDAVLRELGTLLRETVRVTDIIGRIGGEEFSLLLPATELDAAQLAAERIRENAALAEIMFNGQLIRFTVSVGVAAVRLDAGAGDSPVEQAMARADEALYRAKNSGRNRVATAV